MTAGTPKNSHKTPTPRVLMYFGFSICPCRRTKTRPIPLSGASSRPRVARHARRGCCVRGCISSPQRRVTGALQRGEWGVQGPLREAAPGVYTCCGHNAPPPGACRRGWHRGRPRCDKFGSYRGPVARATVAVTPQTPPPGGCSTGTTPTRLQHHLLYSHRPTPGNRTGRCIRCV